ncbi:hypothetical protein ARHIZOSPH14_22940 [Agromyces rhizosphaerae]|uniref:Dimethylarginine dimethylaminohydrolase n=1 Tax=Agromyces rhizosphaerae TaxID=88374 RepID=A0A9W6FRU8_9MICO|nr:dimethylargininase [Agromyces rhizosphaerae]GLI28052.1 hypothetical protein ARHIZOSPH14_22940 [Agromyces rhizosphaerae]
MTDSVELPPARTIVSGDRAHRQRVLAVFASAGAVAAIALGAALLGVFVAGGQAPTVFTQVGGHFLLLATLAFLLLSAANAVGATRAWFLAVAAGLTSAGLAALVGTTITVLAGGAAPDLRMFAFVLGSLVGINLVFIVSAVLAEVFVAPRVLRAVEAHAPRRGSAEQRLALVRIPASNLDEAELTHVEREPVDAELADEQWDNYCAALVAEGWRTVEVDSAPDLADSVFVEDQVVLFDDLAVITRSGAESRRAEAEAVERVVRSLRGVQVARIDEPGTLDGGDVLKVGRTVYVGSSSRTDAEGIRQLRELLSPRGWTVVAVPVTRTLHLKGAVTALPDGTILGHPDLLAHRDLFPRLLEVPEPAGVAVVELADDTVLMAASAPESAAMVSGLGYRVVTVDISEFEKLEGSVTCLSVRVR